ncbi:hypothetical protein FBQ96_08270 [Nitrospirales bacterium NOB]|nr:MAG: hypothetical protein UZ03_NOB001000586 [Nitrospira sp. OLB3]MBV6471528.1 hypothetical protein [Nitrospirota bacterium]MCE7966191.1 hypothetical protein [Nitrospira sp. NTP2]MCK6492100.1 hypothetical protein [Nitrospira sp.]MDL1889560.1 hypothetical protein [Nitrospirales bacterium NOB]MEB2339207.1 hypothetical protein [Nitrospirales bacterium]
MRFTRTTVIVLALLLGSHTTLSVRPAAAGAGTEALQGLGSYFLTLPYGGLKLAAAVLGTVAGGLGFVFTGGDKAIAGKILGPSLGGDYVITPAHIRGEKDLHFFGSKPAK